MGETFPITVAIVDDDASCARSLTRLLNAFGVRSATYGTAEAFLADRERPRFDCLILDVNLGLGMSGIELARTLAVHDRARPPVIYLSARDDSETRASAAATGCAAYFVKREHGGELVEAILKYGSRTSRQSDRR